ncbi:MAG: NifB/NifX family molybdenum-iron cluster-binding protein [Candidatus Zixiibacteriota bacterium]
MKIAVSSQGQQLCSHVDPRFGRAAYFIIYDSNAKDFVAVSNTENSQAAQGAGIQAAQTVAAQGAEIVVSGSVGPKAFTALQAAGIRIATWHEGTVEQAIALVLENKLEPADRANVRGHWQ